MIIYKYISFFIIGINLMAFTIELKSFCVFFIRCLLNHCIFTVLYFLLPYLLSIVFGINFLFIHFVFENGIKFFTTHIFNFNFKVFIQSIVNIVLKLLNILQQIDYFLRRVPITLYSFKSLPYFLFFFWKSMNLHMVRSYILSSLICLFKFFNYIFQFPNIMLLIKTISL